MDTNFLTSGIFWAYIVPIILILIIAWISLAFCYRDENSKKWYDSLEKWNYSPDIQLTLLAFIFSMILFMVAVYFVEVPSQNQKVHEYTRFIFGFFIVFLGLGFFTFYFLQNIIASFFCFVFSFIMTIALVLEYFKINSYSGWLVIPLLILQAWYLQSIMFILNNNSNLKQDII